MLACSSLLCPGPPFPEPGIHANLAEGSGVLEVVAPE